MSSTIPSVPRKVWAIATPGTLTNLHYEDDLLPPPSRNQVRIKVNCIGLNFADIFAILGVYSATPKEKFIPGLELSGVVEAVGEGVDDKEWLGKRVYAVTRFGAYATFLNLDLTYVKRTPDNWTDQQACAFAVQGITAYYALYELGALEPRQTVLVHSAAGGVGLISLAILEKVSAKVLGTVGTEEKINFLKEKYDNNPNFTFILRDPAKNFETRARQALETINEQGVDIVLDSLMGEWFWANYNLLKSPGRLILFGSASFTPTGNLHPIWNYWSWIKLAWKYVFRQGVDPMTMIAVNKSILAFNLIHVFEKSEKLNKLFDELISLDLRPPFVGHEFSFEQLPEAITFFQSGKNVGKVVVNVIE